MLVGDNAACRLFHYLSGKGLEEVEVLINPDARMAERELVTDGPGHGVNRARQGRFAMQSPTDAKRHASDEFARKVAEHLDAMRRRNELGRLHLIAQPAFLGRLRAHLDPAMAERVVSTLDKDLHSLDPAAIREYLPRHI